MKLQKLRVLWIEAKHGRLFAEMELCDLKEDDIGLNPLSNHSKEHFNDKEADQTLIKYNFRKLFLGGIDFVGLQGQEILLRLDM